MKAAVLSDQALRSSYQFDHCDHFIFLDTALWTVTASDLGGAAVGDAAGGILVVSCSDGTPADNDETYVATKEIFKIGAGKAMHGRVALQFTEAATNAANVLVGFMDAMIANSLQDNGLGPKASFSGAAFYKVDGGRNWWVVYSDGATQEKVELTAAASLSRSAQQSGGAAYQTLEVVITPKNTTQCDVEFLIDGRCVYKMLDKTFANATEMSFGFGAKAGTAAAQTINVDLAAFCSKV